MSAAKSRSILDLAQGLKSSKSKSSHDGFLWPRKPCALLKYLTDDANTIGSICDNLFTISFSLTKLFVT